MKRDFKFKGIEKQYQNYIKCLFEMSVPSFKQVERNFFSHHNKLLYFNRRNKENIFPFLYLCNNN